MAEKKSGGKRKKAVSAPVVPAAPRVLYDEGNPPSPFQELPLDGEGRRFRASVTNGGKTVRLQLRRAKGNLMPGPEVPLEMAMQIPHMVSEILAHAAEVDTAAD
jgi:hypothetical protein